MHEQRVRGCVHTCLLAGKHMYPDIKTTGRLWGNEESRSAIGEEMFLPSSLALLGR